MADDGHFSTSNEKGNRYALHDLRDKRTTLAGEIADFKKQLAWRANQRG